MIAEPAAIGHGFGYEGSGIITAVGSGVTKHKVGDRVMVSGSGSFSSSVQTLGLLCEKIPDDMTFEQAATLPVVYSTVIYGLLDKGGLTKGMVSFKFCYDVPTATILTGIVHPNSLRRRWYWHRGHSNRTDGRCDGEYSSAVVFCTSMLENTY